VGKRITFNDEPKEKDWVSIVGVVGDVKDTPASAAAEPGLWFPVRWQPFSEMSIVIRSGSDTRSLIPALRQQLREMDPRLALSGVRLMDQVAEAGVATPRFALFLIGLFASLALVLAAIGTYGVMAYSASQRTHEFGVRMALGAQRSDVLALILGKGMRLATVGVALGIGGALALARVLQSLLYGVKATDPLTFVAVSLMATAIATLACYVPARRATSVDPVNALRSE
jgi:ABC-type antimicrobial peptide transport system permease subunit